MPTRTTSANNDEYIPRTTSTRLDFAQWFLGQQVPVIPIALGQKTPTVAWKKFQQRVPTQHQVEKWFAKPTNYGIVTGSFSNIVVVDADSPETVGHVEQNWPTPWITLTARGQQFFYRHPGGTVPNKAHVNGVALDIRGDGGYVVGPGSVHPTGVVYSTSGNWSVRKEDLPIFPAEYFTVRSAQPSAGPPKRESAAEPTAALDETDRSELVERARAYLASCERPVKGSGSDSYVFRVCCRLLGHSEEDIGLTAEEALPLLQEWQPDFDEAWFRQKLQNALKYSRGESRSGSAQVDEGPPTEEGDETFDGTEDERGSTEFQHFGLLDWAHLVTVTDSAQRQEWLIDQFIYRKGVVFLCGEWGLGKSPFVLQMLLCLAAGIPFLNHSTDGRKLRVLYADFENPSFVVKETLERLAAFLGLKQVPPTFRVWSPNYSPRGDSVGRGGYSQQLELILQKCGPFDVVVIDPLRSFDKKAETDNESAMAMIATLRRWATHTGVVPMFVHHPKKGTTNGQGYAYSLEADPSDWMERASGAGALVSNTDVRIGFDSGNKDELIIRIFLKGQGWQACQYLTRERDDEGNGLGYRLKIAFDKLSPDKQEALTSLSQFFSTGDLKKVREDQGAGFSDGTVGELLGEYQALGLILRVKRGQWERQKPI